MDTEFLLNFSVSRAGYTYIRRRCGLICYRREVTVSTTLVCIDDCSHCSRMLYLLQLLLFQNLVEVRLLCVWLMIGIYKCTVLLLVHDARTTWKRKAMNGHWFCLWIGMLGMLGMQSCNFRYLFVMFMLTRMWLWFIIGCN